MRINPVKTQKEPTYQVVLDALAFTTCYLALLITVDVPEIYMDQFWFTINKKESTLYRLANQDFDKLPSDEEIVSVIKELGHKGDIKSITKVVVDHMYKPWITFAVIINKCLSGKITGRLHIPNREQRPQEARKDMQESNAYKTYLAYATSAASPKMKRKLKKPASPSKKRTLVTVQEEEPEPSKKVVPTKKPATKRQSSGVQIRDTPGVSVSKKKARAKALKRSKRETTIHQVGGSSEGADSESEVPDKPKGKSIDTSKGTGLKPGVLDVSKGDSFECEYESWGDSGIEDVD
ncbi:hypothetical protein Tco_0613832 [Tanacetum coccineum]